jgi:hypothetical protein
MEDRHPSGFGQNIHPSQQIAVGQGKLIPSRQETI